MYLYFYSLIMIDVISIIHSSTSSEYLLFCISIFPFMFPITFCVQSFLYMYSFLILQFVHLHFLSCIHCLYRYYHLDYICISQFANQYFYVQCTMYIYLVIFVFYSFVHFAHFAHCVHCWYWHYHSKTGLQMRGGGGELAYIIDPLSFEEEKN